MLHHLPDEARHCGIRPPRWVLKPGGRLFAVDFGGVESEKHGPIARHSNHAHFDIHQVIPELNDAGAKLGNNRQGGISRLVVRQLNRANQVVFGHIPGAH